MSADTTPPRMVGRDAELGLLRGALREGRAGHPRVVVVRGEAGIGKTRLLQEFRDEALAVATAPPVVVAVGQCVDMGDIGSPFTPIRRLLRELYVSVGDQAFRDAAQTPTVVATLATLLPELSSDGTAPPDTGADYITESIERVIERLSQDHHLVLVIEDLHWADAATLGLLKTLAVTLRGSHVTVVMTYRSDDVGRGHPLRPVLAELDRNRAVTGLEVRRLTPDETAELAQQATSSLDADAIATIVARSDGVPFFVEELVELEDDALPETLRDLVLARFERLGDAARDAVGTVAAAGVRVENDLLEEVHDGDRDLLRAGLREALAANVLVADADGYAFRHALIQEAVHDELLPSERAELHGRYAAALQRRVDGGHPELAAEAAEHWLQARDLPRTFDALVVARRHAESTWAPTTAARLGERMLELWPQVPDAETRSGSTQTALYAETAFVWRLQDNARTLRLVKAGLAVTPAADRLARARLHVEAATADGNAGRVTETLAKIDQTLALLDEDDDDDDAHALVRARALGLKATLPSSAVGGDEARSRIAADALAAAERSHDPGTLTTALTHVSWPLIDRGDLDEALLSIRRAARFDLPADRRLHATITELDALVRLGRFAEAVDVAERMEALATEVGLARSLGAMIGSNRAEALLGLGHAREGLATAQRCRELLAGMPTFRSFCLRLLTVAASWDDRLDDAERIRDQERDDIEAVQQEDPEERIGWAEFDAESTLNLLETQADTVERGRLVETAVAAALVLDHEDFLAGPGTSRRLLPGAARALAEADLSAGDADARERLRRTVAASVSGQPDDGPGRALASVAEAEAARAAGAGAVDAWRRACAVIEKGLVPVRYRHYARLRLAEALVADGARDEASALLAAVIEEAPRHGAAAVARWARDLAARAGIAIEGTDASASRLDTASGVSSLTPRELQVLALVAEGLTNPEIGKRLFISPKTASVHVSAILAKVGAANRAEAAAVYAQAPTAG